MKAIFRLIGDVHSDFDLYRRLCDGAEYTLQVGDMCAFGGFKPLESLDPTKHKAIAGNHDICEEDHPHCFRNDPHFLDDFGIWGVPGIGDVFYLRGAFSIDGVRPNEELTEEQLEEAFEFYKAMKPRVVVTHDCPSFLTSFVGNKALLRSYGLVEPRSATQRVLARMFEECPPAIHVFGHFHRRWEGYVGDTRFICLDMLSNPYVANCPEDCYVDLDGSKLSVYNDRHPR